MSLRREYDGVASSTCSAAQGSTMICVLCGAVKASGAKQLHQRGSWVRELSSVTVQTVEDSS